MFVSWKPILETVRAAILFAACLSLSAFAVLAQEGTGSLKGLVRAEHNKQPIVGARVEVLELRRSTRTDSKGRFEISRVGTGTWNLLITAQGYSDVTQAVTVPGEEVELAMDLQFHDEPVVVTASPNPRDQLQVYQPAEVISGEKLEQRATSSLGTTLQYQPGVASTELGTAPSRPVVRGLGGDRVLILEDGTRSGDVSSLSPDHAVAVNPATAESIEVVRGAANLLYGSNAIGGVINVISHEIPTALVERPEGRLTTGGSSNTGELMGALDFSASTGPVAYRVGASRTDSGEFDYPGGTAGNSQFDTNIYSGGLSLVGSAGYIGAAYRRYESDWGIPVSEDREALEAGEAGVILRGEQDSFKLRGEITKPFGAFEGARIQASTRDWEHTEFEDTGEAATVFNQTTTEVRTDFTHKPIGRLRGTFGLWYMIEDLKTIGDEAVVPKADTTAYAAFFYEELGFEPVKLLFGGRWDSEEVDPSGEILDPAFFPLIVSGAPIVGPGVEKKDYSAFSGALGAIFNPEGRWSIAANVTRNFKAPAGEEVFSFGPHIATQTFEVGNGELQEETSIGYDLSFRWNAGRFRGELTGYRTDFSDYIFLDEVVNDPNNPVLVGGQPFDVETPVVGVYSQADALFQGIEAHADIALLEHLHLEIVGDTVRATNDETDEPFPHIPPMRAGLGIDWDTDRFGVGGEARYAAKQDRVVSDIESPTNAYTAYNVFAHLQFPSGAVVHRFTARVDNLTDRLYRNHVSIVKDLVPSAGRTARVGYSLLF